MTKIDDLKGCYFPLTPKGIACLVGDIPWHYGTEYLTILYHTQPGAIASTCRPLWNPAPIQTWPMLRSVSGGRFQKARKTWLMSIRNRTQYREAAIWASCSFQGQPAQICLHIWVDNDFSMARGWFMGFPKKLGEISMTEYQPLNPIMPPLGVDSRMKGFVSTHGERLIEGSMEIKRSIKPAELPKPIGLPVFHIRHFPSIVAGADPSVLELVKLGAENVHQGKIAWEGSGDLKFYPSEIEEHMDLSPREILGAYFYSSGYTFPGGEVVHDWL